MQLTQINNQIVGSHRISTDYATKVRAMFDSSELRDELQALKSDVSRLLNTTSEGIFDASKNRAEALADQIKAALNDLGETLSEEEGHIENFIRIARSRRSLRHSRSASSSVSCSGDTKVNTENVVKNLRVLWRTDRIIADIRMRHMLVGLGLRAYAALIAAFGLLMLELSVYFALVQVWSAISAAAILGAVNFAIAAILFVSRQGRHRAVNSNSQTKSTVPRSTRCSLRRARCSHRYPERSTTRSTAFCLC